MKRHIFICLFLIPLGLFAQNEPPYSGLRIGDRVPDVELSKIINSSAQSARISDYRGKVLIIDFWATSCLSCLNFLPHTVSLNKDLKDIAAIIPVTTQSEDVIKNFLNKNLYLRPYNITTVVGDVELTKLFPHYFMPYDVWIGPDGKVDAITLAEDVTPENIMAVSKGIRIPNYASAFISKFPNDKPLFFPGTLKNTNGSDILAGTIISGNLLEYDMGQFIKTDSARHSKRITYVNNPYWLLFLRQFKDPALGWMPSRQIIADSLKEIVNRKFSFEVIAPDNVSENDVVNDVRRQIDQQLNISGKRVFVLQDCWVLTKIKEIKFPTVKRMHMYNPDDKPLSMLNCSTEILAEKLNNQKGNLPVMDETGSKAVFVLNMKKWPSDINEWNNELYKFGFKFIKDRRNLEMYVLERNNSLSTPLN